MADEKDLMEKLTDQAIVALWPKVQQGDSKAIDQITRLFERKKKLRPKRRYRMSPKALQQRRIAALKTGQHAKQPPGVMMRKAREAEWAVHGRNGFKIDDELVKVFEQAIQNDPDALKRLTGGQLAALAQLLQAELMRLQDEGMAQLVPILDGDGDLILDEDGEAVMRTVVNPRSDAVLRLAKLLGIGADDQRLTPKGRGKAVIAESMTDTRQFMLETYRLTEASRKSEE